MTSYSYDDFPFDKPFDEWTEEQKAALMAASNEIVERHSSDNTSDSEEASA